MISFRQYLLENKIPQGVLIHNNKILVGVMHGKPVDIHDPKLVDTIKSHGERHGFWYEGSGAPVDIQVPLFGLKSKRDYAGGWDADRMKKIKETGVEPHMLSVVYGNVDVNWKHGLSTIADESGSIFDGIYSWANSKHSPFEAHEISVSRNQVEDFLLAMRPGTNRDWLQHAKQTRATPEATKQFLKDAEAIAWPKDWNTRERTTGPEKLSDTESQERNLHIINNMGPGVYFAGAGHLKQVRDILNKRGTMGHEKDFHFYGGEQIN